MKAFKIAPVLVLCVIAFFHVSCKSGTEGSAYDNKQDGKLVIKGEVTNPQSQEVILEKIVDDQLVGIDTFMMDDDNTFVFHVNIEEPDYYRINIGGVQKRILILNKNDLFIKAGGSGMNDAFEVKGSLEMDQIASIEKIVDSINQDMTRINTEYMEATQAGDQSKVEALTHEFETLQRKQEKTLKEHIQGMEPSLAIISALSFVGDQNVAFVEEVFGKIEALYPDSKHVKQYREQLDNSMKLSVGKPAPEISLPAPNGDTITLSSLRGKVVLIDFWAAWCGPCRKENPNVVRLYNQYKDKGFEIYAVSLDRSRDAWLKAIKDDNLTWVHVSDLKYFNSVVVPIYNIEGIPFTVLVDRDGNIIAKNLRGKTLADKLKEVLG